MSQTADVRNQVLLLMDSVGEMDTFKSTKEVEGWNEWRRKNREIIPCLDGIDLSGRNLSHANFREMSLRDANLSSCRLVETDFVMSDLRNVDLQDACLYGALMDKADLTSAKLMRAILWWVTLVETKLTNANISCCKVYGVSPWNVCLDGATQTDLDISRYDEETLTVDDLEIAHFVYLLLNNKKLRNVIDTITSKAVLILGRFTDERKAVLEDLKEALRCRNYLPMLFDFNPSKKRDLTETVQLMANLAKFVIADITEAKSIPQELNNIIPNLPSVPVQPIVLKSDRGYAMFKHWERFNSVLPVLEYENQGDLINYLDGKLIGAVDEWTNGLDLTAALQQENRALQDKLRTLEARLASIEEESST